MPSRDSQTYSPTPPTLQLETASSFNYSSSSFATAITTLVSNTNVTTATLEVTSLSRLAHDVRNTSENLRDTGTPFPTTTTENVYIFNTSQFDENSSFFVDVEQFLQRKNDEFTRLVLPAIIFLGILSIVGVAGNSMVLYIYNRQLRKGTIRWFVQALAVFDLLSCLVAIPAEIIDMRSNYTFGSSPMCKVLRTVSMFCTVASGVTLMVVAVERYKRICTPLRKQISPRGAQMIITLCGVAASICAAPASIIYGSQTTPTDNPAINGSDCSFSDVFIGTVIPLAFSSFQFLLFITGAIGLVVLYSLIGRKIWTHAHFRKVGFSAGVNRRMSYIFTGSECSSPTTEDLVFAFPVKKNGEEGNSCNGNNDHSDNNNVKQTAEEVSAAGHTLNGVLKTLVYETPSNVASTGDEASDAIEEQAADTNLSNGHTHQPVSVSKNPPSPTSDADVPKELEATQFKKVKPMSRQTSRDRHRSSDSTGQKGRYRRRSSLHTQSDVRRFLGRSNSVHSSTRRTTLMLFLITLVYLLSFLPYLVLMIVKVLDRDSLSGSGGGWELLHNFLLRSYFINSMANPIIYSFCSRTFRVECSKILRCRCCRQPVFVR